MLGSVFFADDGELSQLDFISVGYFMCIILAIAAEAFHWRLYLTMFVARKCFYSAKIKTFYRNTYIIDFTAK